MTRYLWCLAVLGVVTVPDWATAYHPCWAPPPCGPAPVYPRQFYLVPPYAPVYEVPLPPPLVYPTPRTPVAAAPRPQPAPAAPAPPPVPPAAARTEDPPVRPAAAVTPPAPPTPAVVPPTAPPAMAPPASPPSIVPVPPANPPAAKGDVPVIPPLVLPMPPEKGGAPPAAKGSSLVLPPDLPLAPAVPTPAPPPDVTPKRPAESIPPLVLPLDGLGGPSGVVPPTTSRSSPLAAAGRVQVFPVAAGAVVGATRRVGFFNHTDLDIPLTIEGRTVTLPAKSFLHAQLAPTFRWSEAGGPARTTTVPADSPGVDVLFRAAATTE